MKNLHVLVFASCFGLFLVYGNSDVNTNHSLKNNEERDVVHPSLSLLDIHSPRTITEFNALFLVAQNKNKAVLIYFNGVKSVNCRKMERYVWEKEPVYSLLKDEFLIISLEVDKKVGVEDEISWLDYERKYYERSIQPIYDIVNYENQSFSKSVGTLKNCSTPELFNKWLKDGLDNLKKTDK